MTPEEERERRRKRDREMAAPFKRLVAKQRRLIQSQYPAELLQATCAVVTGMLAAKVGSKDTGDAEGSYWMAPSSGWIDDVAGSVIPEHAAAAMDAALSVLVTLGYCELTDCQCEQVEAEEDAIRARHQAEDNAP